MMEILIVILLIVAKINIAASRNYRVKPTSNILHMSDDQILNTKFKNRRIVSIVSRCCIPTFVQIRQTI